MGHFDPGHEPNRLNECPWASKNLRAEEVPTFVGGTCTCKDKGGCVQGIPNDNYEPKKHPEEEKTAGEDGEKEDGEKKKEKKGWFW